MLIIFYWLLLDSFFIYALIRFGSEAGGYVFLIIAAVVFFTWELIASIKSFFSPKSPSHNNYHVSGNDIRLESASENQSITPSQPPKKSSPVLPASASTPSNQRFCKYCGGSINPDTKQCTSCGKQFFKGISLPVAVMSIFLVILAVALVVVGTKNNRETNNSYNIPQQEAVSVQYTPSMSTPSPKPPYYEELGLTLDQYKLASMVAYDVYEYCEHMAELKDMIAKGTYSEDLKQEKVIDYLNNHETLEYGEKIILYRFLFPYDNEYSGDIVDYLNERDDVSYDEMAFILEELGFAVFEDGTIKW